MSLMLASYNIHRCYGRDGRYDSSRIRWALRQLNADIIALQEVELLHTNPDVLNYFCEDSSWTAIAGLTLSRETGHYGNALLTSLPVRSKQAIDLSLPRREPRGALHVTLEHPDFLLDVIATHLGLRPHERRCQIQQLLRILQNSTTIQADAHVTLLMGDLNEWFLWGRPLRWLCAYFQDSPAPASYPARYPLFALDRIWVRPGKRLLGVKAVNNKLSRIASDHLPLVASVE